jgi:hypothetical protein
MEGRNNSFGDQNIPFIRLFDSNCPLMVNNLLNLKELERRRITNSIEQRKSY